MRFSLALIVTTFVAFVAAAPPAHVNALTLKSRQDCSQLCREENFCCTCPGGGGCYECAEGNDSSCAQPFGE
ncbi:hypothetical protein COCCADRAFT_5007 [Bipolaris zeicola 26-R-13]|uniref:Uncharacterized protein n=1 Tax=Cochliobolus carbonum (strain 26-R-13) TaxID=930089 RepID=W6Y7J4_COCC2|nr:uncharacterized protein COCCADRAFT_5007 [Bipolaris zeicola 26-R-13]EUC33450.1 hypothetical protein COCCADRAFT_5007 [Bipolaris zeicola 26-R-13]